MRSIGKISFLALAAGSVLILGSCSATPPIGSTTAAATSTAAISTLPTSPAPDATATLPATSPGDGASASQAPASDQPAPSVIPTSASVTLFFIAEGDAGISGPLVGCGDSAVAVTSQTITYTDPVEGALRTLLSNHAAHIGQSGLRNALSDSRLSVDSVDRTGTTITAHLSGTLSMAGECDIPRLEQQLLLTAQQATGAPVAITINGKTLTEALSLK